MKDEDKEKILLLSVVSSTAIAIALMIVGASSSLWNMYWAGAFIVLFGLLFGGRVFTLLMDSKKGRWLYQSVNSYYFGKILKVKTRITAVWLACVVVSFFCLLATAVMF